MQHSLPAAQGVNGDARRLLAAVGISALGTWSYNVGIAVFAYQETGSAAWVAAATVGRYVPALIITSVGSRWADRRPRREVAVASDLICASTMVLLTVIAGWHLSLVLAIALAALSSGVARVQSAAAMATAADSVPESRLAATAATLSTTEAVATAVGPAFAAVVLSFWPPSTLFALNGLTFAISAGLIWGIRVASGQGEVTRGVESGSDDAYAESVRLVWPLLAIRALSALVYGADVVLLAVIATAQLKQGTSGYGWLLAGAGVGGLLTAFWLRRSDAGRTTWVPSAIGMAAYSLPLLIFLLSPGLVESLLVQALRGMGFVLVSATVVTGLQRSVPSSAAGRTFGLSHVVVMAGTSVGALAVPLLLDSWGLHATLVVVAGVPAALTLGVLPWVRGYDARSADAIAALDPKVDLLRRLALFHDASRSTLYAVAEGGAAESLAAGTTLIRQGDPSEALFVVVEGTVEVFLDDASGPVRVRVLQAPTYVGEIGLLHGVARTATVCAASDVLVWRVPSDVFLDAVSRAGTSGALTDGIRVRLGTRASASL